MEGVLVKLWKWLGLAGLAGVAATGAIIARDQRQRAQLSPEQVRDRLHERLDETRSRPSPGA
ncbi:hypothetical protein [Nocardioides caricicola]|uniref:YtxH domain-containing protein n=1 Tax=Nocardioides caricicola TaxID=634770 RepID=A0ABW0N0J6_9ACTN